MDLHLPDAPGPWFQVLSADDLVFHEFQQLFTQWFLSKFKSVEEELTLPSCEPSEAGFECGVEKLAGKRGHGEWRGFTLRAAWTAADVLGAVPVARFRPFLGRAGRASLPFPLRGILRAAEPGPHPGL